MRKLLFCITAIFFSGCASANIPKYIKDTHPYEQVFYSSFDRVVAAVESGLDHCGWVIDERVDPDVYERTAEVDKNSREKILIFTQRHQGFAGLGLRNQRVNIYIRTLADASIKVEVRYLTATSIPFKTFYNYRQDKRAQSLLDWTQKTLM